MGAVVLSEELRSEMLICRSGLSVFDSLDLHVYLVLNSVDIFLSLSENIRCYVLLSERKTSLGQ